MSQIFILFVLLTTDCFVKIINLLQRQIFSNLYGIIEGPNSQPALKPSPRNIITNTGFLKNIFPIEDQEETNKDNCTSKFLYPLDLYQPISFGPI